METHHCGNGEEEDEEDEMEDEDEVEEEGNVLEDADDNLEPECFSQSNNNPKDNDELRVT